MINIRINQVIRIASEFYSSKKPKRYSGQTHCSCGVKLTSYNSTGWCSLCLQEIHRLQLEWSANGYVRRCLPDTHKKVKPPKIVTRKKMRVNDPVSALF